MNEEWLPIVGHEGAYEVSNLGRVRSLDRVVHFRDGRSRAYAGQILKLRLNNRGYPVVGLNLHGAHLVHHLVLTAFVGPRPLGLECRHLDDNPTNNTLPNLAWGTRQENTLDIVSNGNHANANKQFCANRHPYNRENTRVSPDGRRRNCRICNRDSQRRRMARLRAASR